MSNIKREKLEPPTATSNGNADHQHLLSRDDMLFVEVFAQMFKNELDTILNCIEVFKLNTASYSDPYYSEKKTLLLNLIGTNTTDILRLQMKNKLVKYFFFFYCDYSDGKALTNELFLSLNKNLLKIDIFWEYSRPNLFLE